MGESDSGSRASAAKKRKEASKASKDSASAGSSSASGAAPAPSTPAAGQGLTFRTVPEAEEVVATPPKGKKFAKLAGMMGTKPSSGPKKEVVKIGAAIETAEVRARVRVMHAPP